MIKSYSKVQQRSWSLLGLFLVIGGAALMILGALKENVVFFITPSEWMEKRQEPSFKPQRTIRVGGRVAAKSIERSDADLRFDITDGKANVTVFYHGVVPDLFREEQGVVAEGSFNDKGQFIARQILAKHDENYMPREVAEKLKEQNLWRGDKK